MNSKSYRLGFSAISLNKSSLINTKKALEKLYMFYVETFRIILNPSSVKK